MNKQSKTPIYQALRDYASRRVVSFDVPGHKQGKGNKTMVEVFGQQCMSLDLNSSKPLDNLTHPTGVILEAEQLAAEAFHAKHAFLMVGGTTSSVQAMIFSVCKPNDEIILPRNVHKSVINALILGGAIPVYVNPGISRELGIGLGIELSTLEATIKAHPKAKAILVNNPTYYGICSNLTGIVEMAHQYGLKVLVDEAHGTHLYFHDHLPISAMAAKADMAAVSLHKTGGSLTQSSLLLLGESMDPNQVRQVINLTQTTSGSYLLLTSLDVARKELYFNGQSSFDKIIQMVNYARQEINQMGGYYAFGEDLINNDSIYSFDSTKLCIHTLGLGLAGIEVYNLLRDEYNIQIEFGDLGNILAIISVGDRQLELERLLGALAEIKRRFAKAPIVTDKVWHVCCSGFNIFRYLNRDIH